ncbi:MAG TPA: CdvA-like protein [Candidatus Bathyarchaeia archaeon]|jgi:hypothetical protein|nr:CdvA-like protein [Candidatus Bathyarchaeia archaeon]
MAQDPNLFLSVGKQVKDEYGHAIGKIASFALTPSGKFDAVFIEQGDGKFQKHPVENLTIDESEILLISQIKSGTTVLCDQIPLIWRKDQALKDLVGKKKISQEIYEELHNSFDGVLNQLKTEAQSLIEDAEEESARCAEEIRQLNYALVNLELEHEIGKIDEHNYQIAFAIIQESLKRINMEKNDMGITKGRLSNILLGDTTKTPIFEKNKLESTSKGSASTQNAPELPEPPVVVYVKEIGKTGI